MKKIIAYVPLKEDSSRLPNKNFLRIGEIPLYKRILTTLLRIKEIDAVVALTPSGNHFDEIPASVHRTIYSPTKPIEDYNSIDLARIVDHDFPAHIYILAHATTPFFPAQALKKSIAVVLSGDHDSALSVRRIQRYVWYGGYPLNYETGSPPATQLLTPVFAETSGFYVFTKETLKSGRRVGENPFFAEVVFPYDIDIDTKEDWKQTQAVLSANIVHE